MDLKSAIKSQKTEFEELCKTHDVNSLYTFGSATDDTFNENTSDIDLFFYQKSYFKTKYRFI